MGGDGAGPTALDDGPQPFTASADGRAQRRDPLSRAIRIGRAHARATAKRRAAAAQLKGWDPQVGPATARGASVHDDGPAGEQRVAVVLCVWQRIDRLADTIAMLRAQEGPPVSLYIWNNNPDAAAEVDAIVTAEQGVHVEVTHSTRNAGGFGRFYMARRLADRHPFVVFIDDDLRFPPTMVSELLAEARPHSIVSAWAFTFTRADDYWSRVPAALGGPADYCGTCGMVADTSVFVEPGLFECPRSYWFIEDLWLSYYAGHELGWELRKSRILLETTNDGRDQFLHLRRQKSAFLRQLVHRGWSVAARAPEPAAT